MTETKEKKVHEIVIIPENCKGCGICVEFCPTHTLGLKKGKVVVVALESCVGCQLCDIRCPDFAIMVDNPHAHRMIKNNPPKEVPTHED